MPLRGAAVGLHTAAMCNKNGVAFNWHWRGYKGMFHKTLGGENKKMDNKQYTGIILAAVMVAAVFAMTVPMVSAAVNPSGATVAQNGTDSTKPTTAGETDDATGGYVTGLNISGESQSSKWQGYYGNVSGKIVLMDGDSDSMFNWTVDTPHGEVLACSDTSIPGWNTLFAGTAGNLDTACSYTSSDEDSATATFTGGPSNVIVAGQTISAHYATTLPGASGYYTHLLTDASGSTTWTDFIFAAAILDGATGYDGATHDYQMLVPAIEGGSTTTYHFYLELS